MKQLRLLQVVFTFFVVLLTSINTNAQCWYVDDATDSICQTDPDDDCVPILYPDGTPAQFIEALSIDPSGAPVYASDGGQVGILDPATGTFTPFANPSGYADLDGLAWDPSTNKLYASVRSGGNDELVCIETTGPNAGLPVAGTEVEVTGSGPDVDELTVPPNSCSNAGVLYATMSTSTGFQLATIDPTSGVASEIGPFGIPDVESITFDANCNLYANTGSGELYLVDQMTGEVVGDPLIDVSGNDVEGMSCETSTPFGASISNYIWEDTNGDGIQDAGEDPIAGVIVNLLDDMGNPVLDPAGNPITATTDANGEYLFDNLPAGDYTVEIDPSNFTAGGALEGYAQTFDEDGGNDGTIDVTLDSNEDHITADFGFQGTASIGDTIWEDTNGDGVQDPGEAGIAGVTVTLYDDMGMVVATAVTDANGNYDFMNLPPGDYTVTVTPPAGYDNTGDPDGTFDNTTDVTLGPGEDIDVEDFGYQGNGSISNQVWEDVDGDGVMGPGELPIPGVVVNLLDDMGNIIATATTDVDGEYIFPDLPPGDYTVEIPSSNFCPTCPLAGYSETYDEDGGFDSTTDVALSAGEDHITADFGYSPPALPVELVNFKLAKSNTDVLLTWTTSTEINNDYFNIEHSKNGAQFTSIGKVEGAGNAYTERDYSFTDSKAVSGQNFYRLKQVDFNGRTSYSEIRTIQIDLTTETRVFPNPFNTVLQIESNLDNYTIYDSVGKIVKEGTLTGTQIDLSDLREGIYLINLKSEHEQFTKKIIKR